MYTASWLLDLDFKHLFGFFPPFLLSVILIVFECYCDVKSVFYFSFFTGVEKSMEKVWYNGVSRKWSTLKVFYLIR